jgi:hypothetical protein
MVGTSSYTVAISIMFGSYHKNEYFKTRVSGNLACVAITHGKMCVEEVKMFVSFRIN